MKRTLEMKRRRKPTDALLSGSPGTVKNKKKKSQLEGGLIR